MPGLKGDRKERGFSLRMEGVLSLESVAIAEILLLLGLAAVAVLMALFEP